MNLEEFLDYTILPIGEYELKVFMLIKFVIIFMVAFAIVQIVSRVLIPTLKRRSRLTEGGAFALNQLFKYVVYTIAFIQILNALGFNINVIWGGAAALMVGIGLGLQQTFNDLISGIILLVEGTIQVGNVVQIDGMIGKIQRISVRTSEVLTRENITLIVPNSKLTVENVINWSGDDDIARYSVAVGVAYGTDSEKVKQAMLDACTGVKGLSKRPQSFVRFKYFGASSLDFELFFWSNRFMQIEDVKSDIRFNIDRIFKEKDIQIPFPQTDLWIRNPEDLSNKKKPKQ